MYEEKSLNFTCDWQVFSILDNLTLPKRLPTVLQNALSLVFQIFYTPEGSYYVIPPVVRPSVCLSVSNFLCAQLLLQFPSELFETCHNESPWCLVVHLGLRIWIAVCVLKLSVPDFWNNTLFTLNFCPGHNFHTIKVSTLNSPSFTSTHFTDKPPRAYMRRSAKLLFYILQHLNVTQLLVLIGLTILNHMV